MSKARQIPLAFPEGELSFDTMEISDCNRGPIAAVRKVTRWPERSFCLIGAPRSGLTTIALAWATERGSRYIPAAEFQDMSPDTVESLVDHDLVIDDVDQRLNPTLLLMALSAFKRRGRHILMTAHTSPSQWALQLPDLKSRLKALPLAQLGTPDESMIRVRLRRACQKSCLNIPKSVEDYLVTRIGLDYARVEYVADLLAGASGERPLSVPLARELLEDEAERIGDAT